MLIAEEYYIISGFFDGLRPEPILTVSEWADQYRQLSPTASSEPGQWRTDRAPYLREIQDSLSANDPAQEVVVMKGAQLGFTEAGNNWVGYVMDVAPGPALLVMPTDETVKRNSNIRIAPMIEATPRLRSKVSSPKSRDGQNNTLLKSFPGGVLLMTGANSAVGLRSMPIRFLMLDEIDGYPDDLDGEGSPIDLAIARTRTFPRRKIYKLSTPTVDGASAIQREFEATDQRRFFVPCPHCGVMQFLKWERVFWTEGKPETAHYVCEHCNEPIQERFKTTMLTAGQWQVTKPENLTPRKVGYHINSLYSPYGWYSWSDAAREFEASQGDVPKTKTFVNTVLGECYVEAGESPPWKNLYNRREKYEMNKPPKDVAFLTAGVDVQGDRIEVEIVGWCKGKRTYSIDYRIILGETNKAAVWDKLAEIVNETWEREDGLVMPLRLMAVDSGFNTQHVYNFCRRFDYTRVIPIKGDDNLAVMVAQPRAADVSKSGKKIGRVKIWKVGVSIIKGETYGFLKLEKEEETAPAGFCFFPQYDEPYFRGLTAEELRFTTNKRGFKVYAWHKKYQRNEPLDCRVYARAAAFVVGIDRMTNDQIDKMALEYQPKSKTSRAPEKKQRKRSSFWD